MSDHSTSSRPGHCAFIALASCVAIGIFIGFMGGLTLARRMVPAPTESRLVMQLLALEQEIMTAQVQGRQCEPLSPARLATLLALAELVPHSMRDTLAIGQDFETRADRLRAEIRRLAAGPGRDCAERRQLLAAIDSACRNCHLEFRTGEPE